MNQQPATVGEPRKRTTEERDTVQSVERALMIVEALARAGEPLGVTELGNEIGLTPSTVHRLLNTLLTRDFVMQDPISGKYKLGVKLFHIGMTSIYARDLMSAARPILEELAEECNETVNLTTLDGTEVVCIDQIEADRMMVVRLFSRPGSRGPAYCSGSGKTLLAGLSDEELGRVLDEINLQKFTSETITDRAALRKELARIRIQGFGLDLGERSDEVRCVAAPVKDNSERTVASLSVSGPSIRLTNYFIHNELLPLVKAKALKISKVLGFPCSQLSDGTPQRI